MNEIWVQKNRLDSLKKASKRLMKRASLLECDMPVFEFTDTTKVINIGRNGLLNKSVVFFKVNILGSAPVLSEWTVIAKLTHKKEQTGYKNIINSADGVDFNNLYNLKAASLAPKCDHCEVSRFRKTTFLLEHNESGEIIQIGSTCIDDFIRDESLKKLLLHFQVMEEAKKHHIPNINSIDLTHAHYDEYACLKDIVRITLAVISNFGFANKSKAEIEGCVHTAPLVTRVIKDNERELRKEDILDTAEKIEASMVEEILNYLTVELPSEPMNDFSINLLASIENEMVNVSDKYRMALVVGSIGGFVKKKELKERREKEHKFHPSYFGVLGNRTTLALTLIDEEEKESQYGTSVIYTFYDKENRKATWRCSGKRPAISVGTKYELTATIKDHSDYRIPTTVLSRCCKFIEKKSCT